MHHVGIEDAEGDFVGKLGALAMFRDRVKEQVVEQVWNDIHEDHLVLFELVSCLDEVVEAHDLVRFEGTSHHGLILKQAALNRLEDLLGNSVILGHEKAGQWLQLLR